jgi:pimeloyl-ACP methyl ester carboxylesterase
MPGYGRSPGPPTALGITALADWSVRLLDQLALDRAHVAGNSMGCQVAISLAQRHPERVGALVLVGATAGGHDATLSRYLFGLLLDGARESFRYNTTLTRTYLQMGVRRYLATVRQMIQDETLTAASAVAAPTLVLRGEADAIVSEARSRRLTTTLPRGVFLTIPGAAHALQFTHPDSYVPVTVAFLAGAEAGNQNLWGLTSAAEATTAQP